MSEQTEVVDAADEILEGAVEVAEGVVQMARGFSGLALSGAFVAGAGVGGVLGYILCKRSLETKYSQTADEEIAEMRQHYAAKAKALDNETEKSSLENIIREKGYAPEIDNSRPPMAVEPPSAVVDRASEVSEEDVPSAEPEEEPAVPESRNIFRDAEEVGDDWDWHRERSNRSPLKPFVIHRDEREDQQTFDSTTFTYYEEDDVLCNEADEVLDRADRERIVGETNLGKFGHGSGDANAVYIRNPKLEMDIEVIRSPNSYAEEVHGFDPEPEPPILRHSQGRRRARFDDE